MFLLPTARTVTDNPLGDEDARGATPSKPNTTRSLAEHLPELVPSGVPPRLRIQMSQGRASFEVSTQAPIVIGRSTAGGMVEVDLSPYNAADLGISRRHVRLDTVGDRLMIQDLESVNGSSLNGRPLTPNQQYPVSHGDEVKIGRLKMRVFFLYT